MQPVKSKSRHRFAAMLAGVVMLLTTAACGTEGGVATAAPELTSTVDSEWALVDHDGAKFAVGRGVVFEIPAEWDSYEPEKVSGTNSTWEWAVGQPSGTKPLPAYVSISAGIEDQGAQVEHGMGMAALELAKLSSGFELIKNESVDIPGAKEAEIIHFKREVALEDGTRPMAEQLSLLIQVRSGISTTLRFIAPEGTWDETMKDAYESVRVTG